MLTAMDTATMLMRMMTAMRKMRMITMRKMRMMMMRTPVNQSVQK